MKKCPKCRVEKQKSEFYKNKNAIDRINWWCKQCSKDKEKLDYLKNRKLKLAYAKKNYQENPEVHHSRKRLYYKMAVEETYRLLGNKCKRCGVEDKRILQIDHINGGGRKHHIKLNNSWFKFHKDIRESVKNNRNEFQILCANCNWIEAIEKGYRKSIWF